jgi:hypothetical protein
MTANVTYRLALGLAALTALFLVYGIGALGIIGAGGEPDRMYVGVLVVLVVGTVAARLRPAGMALTLFATATAQMLIAVLAVVAGYQDEPGASVVEILGVNAMYAGLFGLSAWLFWRIGSGRPEVPVQSS